MCKGHPTPLQSHRTTSSKLDYFKNFRMKKHLVGYKMTITHRYYVLENSLMLD